MDSSTNKTILLSGSHTWNNLQDIGSVPFPPRMDFAAHLKWLKRYHFNFFRLWHFESIYWYRGGKTKQFVDPHPFDRTGPGTADDGLPKFDLTSFNQRYFDRMRERVIMARDEGFYVAVNLFQGIAAVQRSAEWVGHPFYVKNNINGIDGDPNGDSCGNEVQALVIPQITKIQDAYVRKVVDTLNDLDNVIWEIGNELWRGSKEFQYHMVNLIKTYETSTPGFKRHPIGISTLCGHEPYKNKLRWYVAAPELVFSDPDNPADWTTVSANDTFGWPDYKNAPPAADGHRVLISDTDHLWGVGGDGDWVWRTFCRGLNPIFMDQPAKSRWESARIAMRDVLHYADRIDLARMIPENNLSATRYCLSRAGEQYIVYQPDRNRPFTVNGLIANETYYFEWFDSSAGVLVEKGRLKPLDTIHCFAPPGRSTVLYLNRSSSRN